MGSDEGGGSGGGGGPSSSSSVGARCPWVAGVVVHGSDVVVRGGSSSSVDGGCRRPCALAMALVVRGWAVVVGRGRSPLVGVRGWGALLSAGVRRRPWVGSLSLWAPGALFVGAGLSFVGAELSFAGGVARSRAVHVVRGWGADVCGRCVVVCGRGGACRVVWSPLARSDGSKVDGVLTIVATSLSATWHLEPLIGDVAPPRCSCSGVCGRGRRVWVASVGRGT